MAKKQEKTVDNSSKETKKELSPEELEAKKAADEAKEKERFQKVTKAIVQAFKSEKPKDILAMIGGKLSPAQLKELVDKKKITEDQKNICVECGLQRSSAARKASGGTGVSLAYRWKAFHKDYDPANKEATKPNPKVIAALTELSKKMETFYTDNKATLDIIEAECQAELMTYFRFPAKEEKKEEATPAAA